MKNPDAPKCPSPQRVRQLINEFVDLDKEVVNALDWLATYLENRNLYHKKLAIKNRILIQLAKERGLGDDAEKLASDEVFNTVANDTESED